MNIKARLILMNFLQFAVWGAYLTSMGTYLAESVWVITSEFFMPCKESFPCLCPPLWEL